MKKISLLLFTLLLTFSYSNTAKEKDASVQKQNTTSTTSLPSAQTPNCSPYPLCAREISNVQKTQSLLDWFAKQVPTLEQNKDSSSK